MAPAQPAQSDVKGSKPTSVEALPSLEQRLIDDGLYDKYVAWRSKYRQWRSGLVTGAKGELVATACSNRSQGDAAWRSKYRSWRKGGTSGAAGEPGDAVPLVSLLQKGDTKVQEIENSQLPKKLQEAPAVMYDVVLLDGSEKPALLPVDGPAVDPIPVEAFPPDALVTIRVFRFFEDQSDAAQVWEQELQNVNSGSLVWLFVHMAPGYHSKEGAKYGKWFTAHYIQVYAKHFRSAYFMANDGSSYPAKTFGGTAANRSTVSGDELQTGYFWYVSPATSDEATLQREGWQHLCCAGPFDGEYFLDVWNAAGKPMDGRPLQEVLNKVPEQRKN